MTVSSAAKLQINSHWEKRLVQVISAANPRLNFNVQSVYKLLLGKLKLLLCLTSYLYI